MSLIADDMFDKVRGTIPVLLASTAENGRNGASSLIGDDPYDTFGASLACWFSDERPLTSISLSTLERPRSSSTLVNGSASGDNAPLSRDWATGYEAAEMSLILVPA
uniref:Flavin reductase n=1 Tax=Ascaris lumbricoides TaxID=6252 RepID=A0A0M3HGW9_ASCLU